MAYQITWKEKGTIVDCTGSFSIQELNEANGLLQGDARFDAHTYQIWNLVDADLSGISESDMEMPAATDWAATLSVLKMKVALVAQDNHTIKLCRHYIESSQAHASTWERQLFDAMKDAEEWVEA